MSWYEVVALLAAGMAARTINTIVGAGTLITSPTLLFFGFPPVVANISNTIGLVGRPGRRWLSAAARLSGSNSCGVDRVDGAALGGGELRAGVTDLVAGAERAQEADRLGSSCGTFVAHKGEKRESAGSASVKKPDTQRRIPSVSNGFRPLS